MACAPTWTALSERSNPRSVDEIGIQYPDHGTCTMNANGHSPKDATLLVMSNSFSMPSVSMTTRTTSFDGKRRTGTIPYKKNNCSRWLQYFSIVLSKLLLTLVTRDCASRSAFDAHSFFVSSLMILPFILVNALASPAIATYKLISWFSSSKAQAPPFRRHSAKGQQPQRS